MRLSGGDRLDRFEILGKLGAGGMGEVYRARDPQLQREVAIKVLPLALAHDPDRQRRFEREARAAAGLNHPNIVAVHDVRVHDGVGFLVTELLDGETLRQRMNGRSLPLAKAVDYAIQIASGLAAGHERGIVHRDIKPENLFVTKDGRVKILDFGIARAIEPDAAFDATMTVSTGGTVVGTPAYMSPEQARGLRTDHRSDIFSLGVVLYEMLAGVSPFRRDTTADTLSAILNEEPAALSSIVPVAPALEHLVDHCLEKSADERFQNVRDLKFDLDLHARSTQTTATKTPESGWRTTPLVMTGVVLVVAAAAAGYLVARRGATVPAAATPAVHRLTEFAGLEEFPSISPDEKSVAFTADVSGRRQVFVRLLAGGPSLPITTDQADHQHPRWLPDASSLMYFSPAAPGEAQGAIWVVSALGGSPRRIIGSVGGGDVSKSGRLACFRLVDGSIQLVSASLDGSDIQVVTRAVAGYYSHPRWSPDDRWIAFQQGDGVRNDVFVVAAAGGEPRKLTNDLNVISGLAWTPDGSGIIYGSSRGASLPYLPALSLWEAPLGGTAPRQVTSADVWYEQPDAHTSGRVSAVRKRIRFDIWRFPFDANPVENTRSGVQVTRQTGQVMTPTAAPGDDEIAYLSDSGGHGNLWVMSIGSGALRQITFETDPAVAMGVPNWSPDGKSIAFVSSKGNMGFDFGVWMVNPDGGNQRNMAKRGLGIAWSPDGRWLYYTDTSAKGALKKMPPEGGAAVTVRNETTRNVIGVHGDTLYYMVERPLVDGRPEFDVRAATPEDGPSRLLARIPASRVPSWQIVNPALSPDGRWLALPLTDGFTTNIWALSTAAGQWRQVTDFGDRATFIARRLSWSADGKSLFAAIGEGEADVVVFDGLLDRR
jgi:serine/threonine protein kinase/dipeptidyl aminopeptidase/acylaminoacyl peptidase